MNDNSILPSAEQAPKTEKFLAGSPKPKLEEWEQFVSTLKGEKREADGRYQWMFDFYARWQLAVMYRGIDIGDHALGVLEGYSVLLRVLIACSARELVVSKGSGSRRTPQPIVDAPLATRIRNAWRDEDRDAFSSSLRKSATPPVAVNLNDFWSGKNDDIELIAFPIRHGVAHGSVTATGARLRGVRGGSDKNSRLEIIDAITEAVLNDSASLFLKSVKPLLAK
ncbi:hypothetical protein [Arthrobacter bambusae]|uniref:RiboL-PSP-HEPN domain-containing protein n=1 Tax=Arthrobacter bambusae TaxID=1338426 RepID=A0AAW8DD82_9MICC|nr:hypothetical protein [Arthrobacter bambusae]MDP9903129.1 hypothetical protein [Arthrobacter bambusae]MDQ0128877.1 hypothetical protein [Arthrobacter bambusae]MDQ0180218.1 hypothetical protein [Arthrobacter bambusae]